MISTKDQRRPSKASNKNEGLRCHSRSQCESKLPLNGLQKWPNNRCLGWVIVGLLVNNEEQGDQSNDSNMYTNLRDHIMTW